MTFTPGAAKLIAENFLGVDAVLSQKGPRKGEHIKYAYRFRYDGPITRHISIATRSTEDGVTVYVNQRSANNIVFPDAELRPARATKMYPKGYTGTTGDKGMSSAAAGLPTLDPKDNDVLRLSVPSEDAFRRLLTWYVGTTPTEAKIADFHSDEVLTPDKPLPAIDDHSTPRLDDIDLTGAGYESDPKIRRTIELYAVAKARDYYEHRSYLVTERGKPFDLLCEKAGEILHVEVKGSRYDLNEIIVTTNEVKDAQDSNWRSDLFLVSKIVLASDGRDGFTASQGLCRLAQNWVPEAHHLTPMQYRCKVPPASNAE
jgi:hypothetical protein